jgi:hypothetical protein
MEERRLAYGKEVKWNEDRPREAYELALLGATDKEIAAVMNINVDTVERWKQNHPEFLEKLQEGKLSADAKVAMSLYQCATGYYYPEEHISVAKDGTVTITTIQKYKPRDAWAAKQWLVNRRRADWSDTKHLEVIQTNVNINKIDISVFSKEEMTLIEKMGLKQLTENADSNQN